MSGVDAAEFSGFGGERDEFFGLGVGRGGVFERGRHADCAVFHGVAHESLHLREFGGSGLLVVVAEDYAADLRGADVVGDVDADPLFFEAREILAEGAPVGRDVVIVEAFAA